MIAVLDEERCTSCGTCVAVCPSTVFEAAGIGVPPVVARQEDCQTCFLCELYCQADALFVDPDCENVAAAPAGAVMGEFRRLSGWNEWSAGNPDLHWQMGSVFARAATSYTVP